MICRYLLFFATLVSLIHAADSPAKPGELKLHWTQTETSLALMDDRQIIWQLHYDPSEAKPYFHPITSVDGTVLTALHPSDHPWHRGLWWSWKFINGVNYWDEDKAGRSEGKTVLLRVTANPRPDFSATVSMDLAYQPPDGNPVLTEQREIEVSRPDLSGGVTIGWRTTFTAGTKPVLLDRTPIPGQPQGVASGGYAGLSLRLSDAATEWDFQDSENGHSEAEIHGRTARWVSYTAADGTGFRMIDDEKTNPRFPTLWYASRKLKYFGPAFLYQAPYTLAPGKKLDFAYRIFVNRGPRQSPAPAGETTIKISSVPGKMKYDVDAFQVAPGARVALTFSNNDDMLHNIVICKAPPDFGAKLGQAALELGNDALKKNFVPDIPEVIFHTAVVEPGQAETIRFVAPTEAGEYPFFCTLPGHWAVMRGVMRVAQGSEIKSGLPSSSSKRLPVQELVIEQTARADRLSLPDSSATSLAVGLPGGLNYCFDVENLAVRYVWRGRYLDVAPNFAGRGGETVNLLGKRQNVGYQGASLSLGGNPTPSLAFKGYRTGRAVQLFYSVDGVGVSQIVEAVGHSVRYTFEVQPTTAAIHFKINPAGLRLSASHGNWSDGVLTVIPESHGPTTFSVTFDDE